MATNRNIVFSYLLDIKDFLSKNRQVTQEIGSLRQQATQGGQAVEQYGHKIKSSGEQSAAAAVQFQTATQGMLNLSTAAVQTFTSISNLDRAANRLAQARVAEARAQDLLANKELRLQELQARGLGNTQKAVNLTNEIATARADLAVKTDKLRIEEGALTDVQLLFVSNIANVMISSLQTIKTLKDLNIVSNVRLLLTEKNIFGMGIRQNAQRLASIPIMRGTAMATNMMANANRTLMLTLGPIGIAITAITIGMEAYNNNWLGFRDALQSVFPFLKDTNNELDESARILEEDRNAALGYADAIGSIENALDKLETPYRDYLIRMRDAAKLTGNLNLELEYQAKLLGKAKVGVGFSSPSMGGLPTGQTAGATTAGQTTGNTYTQPTQTTAGTSYTTTSSAGTTPTGTTGTVVGGSSSVSPNHPDPFGTELQKIRFKQLNIKEQYDQYLLLAVTEDNAGNFAKAGQYLDGAIAIRNEALRYEEPKDTGPYAINVTLQEAKASSFKGRSMKERIEAYFQKSKTDIKNVFRLSSSDAAILADDLAGELVKEIDQLTQQGFFGTNRGRAMEFFSYFDEFGNRPNIPLSIQEEIRRTGLQFLYGSQDPSRRNVPGGLGYFQSPDMPGYFFSGLDNGPQSSDIQGYYRQAAVGRSIARRAANLGPLGSMYGGYGQAQLGRAYSNATRNAYQLEAYGATSRLDPSLPASIRFGPGAVSSGMVSVSEVQGGAIRFAQRNNAALMARRAEIAREDAWRNSVIGQNAQAAQALLTGGSFAYSRRVARAGGGLSQDMALTIRAAGLLGVSVPYEQFNTTASQIFTGASAGLSEIVKANNVRQEFLFAAMNAISLTAQDRFRYPYGHSSIRQGNYLAGPRRDYTSTQLQNYVSRVAQGNFGIYDATVLNAMTGATVSEFTSEISDFNSKIAPLLNIAHSDFKTTLVDPKRGINEIDDRIRWTQRLEQISTGATVF